MTLDEIRQFVHVFVRPLSVRISNLISRGVVKQADDSKKVQELQLELLDDETRDEVEHFQHYGFTSVPLEGAEAVVICIGGSRDQAYCVGTADRRHRIINLSAGEVAVHNNTGAKIVLKANGDIEVTPKAGQKIKLVGDTDVTGTLAVTGDSTVSGTLTATTDVVGGGKSLKTHTHSVAGTVAAAPGAVVFVPPALTGAPS